MRSMYVSNYLTIYRSIYIYISMQFIWRELSTPHVRAFDSGRPGCKMAKKCETELRLFTEYTKSVN